MNKERLEEITSSVGILLSGDRHVLLRREHYEWLIEQAERVEKLEKQNKRYREALEEILVESYEEAGLHPDTNMQLETFIAKTARKALEGEE